MRDVIDVRDKAVEKCLEVALALSERKANASLVQLALCNALVEAQVGEDPDVLGRASYAGNGASLFHMGC